MSRLALRSLIAVAIALGAPPAQSGQKAPDIGGIIGAILNSAVINEAREEWRHRPPVDYNCLEAHNISADQLSGNGIGPNDPPVQRMFAQCARDAAKQTPASIAIAAPTGPYNPDFVDRWSCGRRGRPSRQPHL